MTESRFDIKPSAWPGSIPLQSLYTAGTGGQIFFEALKQRGQFIGTRCRPCAQVYLPARSFCERCFDELSESVEVKRTGQLVSYTICYVDNDHNAVRRPVALGLVKLDGATTVFLHRLIGVREPAEVSIGCRVEARVKAKKDRVGSILDIEGFRLLST